MCYHERARAAEIAAQWPHVDQQDEDILYAINDAMNNLLGYPHRKWEELDKRVSASPREIDSIFRKWRRIALNK